MAANFLRQPAIPSVGRLPAQLIARSGVELRIIQALIRLRVGSGSDQAAAPSHARPRMYAYAAGDRRRRTHQGGII